MGFCVFWVFFLLIVGCRAVPGDAVCTEPMDGAIYFYPVLYSLVESSPQTTDLGPVAFNFSLRTQGWESWKLMSDLLGRFGITEGEHTFIG